MASTTKKTEFKITDEKINRIAETFEMTQEQVKIIHEKYNGVSGRMIDQYLAHVMRSLENYIREEKGWAFFRITCNPSIGNTSTGIAMAVYQEKYSFDIVYDKNLLPLQKRVCIAHELGHLFVMIVLDKDQQDKHEPLSSVIGIFTMLDKNDFYYQDSSHLCHSIWEDVVKDFSLLKNKKDGKPNIS